MIKKFLFKMTKSMVISYVLGLLKKESFKNDLVKKINAKVDIPGLGEKQEKQIFDAVYAAVNESLEEKYG